MVLHSCCLAGVPGAAIRKLLPENSRLLLTFLADSNFEAMTIYNRFLGREPYSTVYDNDHCAYPKEWLDEQNSVDCPASARLGEFTNAWFELDIVNIGWITQFIAQRDPNDNNPEHVRYAAFQYFLVTNRPLPRELCWRLYDLGCADVDLAMGGAMMADVIRLAECPSDLLTKALSSNKKHIVAIATRRLDARP